MRLISLTMLATIAAIACSNTLAMADESQGMAQDQDHIHYKQSSVSAQGKMWQAEDYVLHKTSAGLLPGEAVAQKEHHKGPVRSFMKAVAKGTASEFGADSKSMAEDMVFVFSAQDIDPYAKKGPPTDKPAIVLKFNLIDGSSSYLRRFPDGSYCIEDGFADGTVLIPNEDNSYLVKYPNGAKGRLVRQPDGTTIVYRPDNTTTTISKTNSGGYSVRNSKLGYMGEARPDRTGVNYELGVW